MNATILIHSLLQLRKKIPCPLLRGMVYILNYFCTVKLAFFSDYIIAVKFQTTLELKTNKKYFTKKKKKIKQESGIYLWKSSCAQQNAQPPNETTFTLRKRNINDLNV